MEGVAPLCGAAATGLVLQIKKKNFAADSSACEAGGTLGYFMLVGFFGLAHAYSITSCGLITTPGTYYLQNNLNGVGTSNVCIWVAASNVDLECQGYTIDGAGTSNAYGIYAGSGLSGVTIDQCNVKHYYAGIYAYSISGSYIDYNTLASNRYNIIAYYLSGGSYIYDNTAYQIGGDSIKPDYGIDMSNSPGNNVMYNTVENSTYSGIYMARSGGNYVTGNNVYVDPSSTAQGVQLYLSNYNNFNGNSYYSKGGYNNISFSTSSMSAPFSIIKDRIVNNYTDNIVYNYTYVWINDSNTNGNPQHNYEVIATFLPSDPSLLTAFGAMIQLSTSGTTQPPLTTLQLGWDNSQLNGYNVNNFGLYAYNSSSGVWNPVNLTPNVAQGTLTASNALPNNAYAIFQHN